MNIDKALRLFNIDDINNISTDGIKKTYRKLMLVNHPDKGGCQNIAVDINEAYNILKDLAFQLEEFKSSIVEKNTKRQMCIIDIDKYADIYSGAEYKVYSSKDSKTLSKSTLSQFRVMLDINIAIEINGVINEFNKVVARDSSDVYMIDCKIPKEYGKDLELTIKAYGKSVNITMKDTKIALNLSLNNGVKLVVGLEERVINNDK